MSKPSFSLNININNSNSNNNSNNSNSNSNGTFCPQINKTPSTTSSSSSSLSLHNDLKQIGDELTRIKSANNTIYTAFNSTNSNTNSNNNNNNNNNDNTNKNGMPLTLPLSIPSNNDLMKKIPSLEIPRGISSAPNRPVFSINEIKLSPSQQTFEKLKEVDEKKYKEIMENVGIITINGEKMKTNMHELQTVRELGAGTCGHVIEMKHNKSGKLIAVKQMGISGVFEENKRILMDLDVVTKCNNCENIVGCLGYFVSDSEVWICMDLMKMCFDKLLKLIKSPLPENILGKLTVCTLNALSYLKDKHNVIHRDIKPSNLLINEDGDIKLCDFGISGNLVDSRVQTRSAGCAGYMSPERIEPHDKKYDIRADVWSLGITLVELATGEHPYKTCSTEFEVMAKILNDEPPKLIGNEFSDNFKTFVEQCLTKDVKKRPKYTMLMQHPFVLQYKEEYVDVKGWFNNILTTYNC